MRFLIMSNAGNSKWFLTSSKSGILPMIFIGREKNLVEKDKEQIEPEPAPRIEVMLWDGRRRPSQYFWKDGIGLCFLVFWVRCTPKGIDATNTFNRESSTQSKSTSERQVRVRVQGIMWDLRSTVPVVGFADAFKDSNIPFIVYIPFSCHWHQRLHSIEWFDIRDVLVYL